MPLTTKEIAARVGLTRGRIYQMIWDGEIAAVKHGRDYLIEEDQIPVITKRPDRRGGYARTSDVKSTTK